MLLFFFFFTLTLQNQCVCVLTAHLILDWAHGTEEAQKIAQSSPSSYFGDGERIC